MIKRIANSLIRTEVKYMPCFFVPSIRYKFSEQPLNQTENKTQNEIKNQAAEQEKVNQAIARCIGLNQFMTRIYNTTGLTILFALATSYVVISIPILASVMTQLSLYSVAGVIGGFVGAAHMKPKTTNQTYNGLPIYKTSNSPLRLGLYALGAVSLGICSAPLFFQASAISPYIVPTSIGITMCTFGGPSLIAYNMPKGKMLGYGGAIGGSVLGIIGLQSVGLLSMIALGPNPFSLFLFKSENYVGIVLAITAIAYDTHMAIKMYDTNKADHLGANIQFVLNFWNILIRIVGILSKKKN